MAALRLHTAFWNYDRTAPLLDGRVPIEGVELDVEVLTPEATFSRAYDGLGFDVCEASFANTVTALSKDECPYILLPAFLSRAFRHSSIWVRRDRGINRPCDLRGKAIGLQEYGMTAAVVVRGLLRDHYGIDPSEILWKEGDGDAKPPAFPRGAPPANVCIEPQKNQTVAGALLAGEIDAAILLRIPPAFAGGEVVQRLFANPSRAEREWFQEAGVFPIMHAVGLRRSLHAEAPGLAYKLYSAFLAARDLAVRDLELIQVPKVTLPWPHTALEEARALMGPDHWPYGILSNRHVLETQLRWSWLDGLQQRRVSIEELFSADCLST